MWNKVKRPHEVLGTIFDLHLVIWLHQTVQILRVVAIIYMHSKNIKRGSNNNNRSIKNKRKIIIIIIIIIIKSVRNNITIMNNVLIRNVCSFL